MKGSFPRLGSIIATAAVLVIGSRALAIKNPTPVGAGDLLGMVGIAKIGRPVTCSGQLVDSNTVITAAHCVCTLDNGEGNVCNSVAEVLFRENPLAPGLRNKITGEVTVHPDYDRVEYQAAHDLAVIKLQGVSPAHAKPFIVSDGHLDQGALAMLVGQGNTGSDCSGPRGTFNYDLLPVHSYVDGSDIIGFADQPGCDGDSGGAVLDEGGSWLFGVIAANGGSLTKANTTGSHFDWIKSKMCSSSAWNQCDGDGYLCNCSASTNILWRNSAGELAIWFMDGGTITGQAYPGVVQHDWKIEGSGDFNGDGHSDDILWRHANGQTVIWHMIDGAIAGQFYPGQPDPHDWAIQGVGDFDGDRHSDILWRSAAGQLAIWFQGDAAQAVYPGYNNQPAPVDLAWQVIGSGDVNGDSYSDIFWRHTDGRVSIWFMAGDLRVGESAQAAIGHEFQVQAIGDFDGNLRSDILWRHATNGLLRISFNGNAISPLENNGYPTYANQLPNFSGTGDPSWQVQGVGDFDHDGRDDILWRHSGGQLALWLIDGLRFVGDLYPQWVQTDWQIEGLMRPGMSSTSAIALPEPGGLASLVLGVSLLAALRRRRNPRR